MTADHAPYRDPLIEEVRQRRRELFAKCNGELAQLCEAIRKCQSSHPEQVVNRRKDRLPKVRAGR